MPEDEQVLQHELEMMVTQELVANAIDDVSRQAFEEEKRRIASQKKAAQAIMLLVDTDQGGSPLSPTQAEPTESG
ncbi:hypothetical protein Tco_0415937 [Tanacetum coccineum]